MTNYGKIDISGTTWRFRSMREGWDPSGNEQMVFGLQPDILINNRNRWREIFPHPSSPPKRQRDDWESCMTINDSWGYHRRTTTTGRMHSRLVQNLVECCRDGGNYLLTLDPEPMVRCQRPRLTPAGGGQWLQKNGEAVYGTQRCCNFRTATLACTRAEEIRLYTIIYYWPGETMTVGGCHVQSEIGKIPGERKERPVQTKRQPVDFLGPARKEAPTIR